MKMIVRALHKNNQISFTNRLKHLQKTKLSQNDLTKQ